MDFEAVFAHVNFLAWNHIEAFKVAPLSKYPNLGGIFEGYGDIGVMFYIPKVMPIVWRVFEAIVKIEIDGDHVVALFFVFYGQFWERKKEPLVNAENVIACG